jgi:hypothetical protein
MRKTTDMPASVLLIALSFFLSPVLARAQDIANGDFETGDLSSWTLVEGSGWQAVGFDHPNKQGRFYASII